MSEVDYYKVDKPSSVSSSLEIINKFKGILEWVHKLATGVIFI